MQRLARITDSLKTISTQVEMLHASKFLSGQNMHAATCLSGQTARRSRSETSGVSFNPIVCHRGRTSGVGI